MPSPFPGMDPYLEHPEFFPGLHDRMINQISDALQAALPPPYYAEIANRVWLEYAERRAGPDVNVLRSDRPPGPATAPPVASAVLVRPVTLRVPTEEQRELSVEVRTIQGGQQLVTAMELLSAGNKKTGEKARELYLHKQDELLRSRVNLVEIDLLRGGLHSTCVPRDQALAQAGPFDYHVCVRRMEERDDRIVYPIRLDQPLPGVAIPLLPGDPDVVIDLQQLFDRCYDHGPYRVRSPYLDRDPVPPLAPEQAEWATRLLREKGLVPSA